MSPSPSTAATAPATATNQSVCEFAQFVTDDNGTVQRCRIVGTEAVWGEPEQIVGRNLLDLLLRTNRSWSDLLPGAAGDGPATRLLPRPHAAEQFQKSRPAPAAR